LWKKTFDKKIVGFKLFIGHNTEILNHVLADKKVKKLLLIRKNIVRLYVSTQIAAMTGEYCKLVNQNAESKRPSYIYFDIQAFLSFAHQIEEFYSNCEATMIETGQKFFKIYYPDILNNSTQNKILKFLEVRQDVGGMHSKFMQQGDYQLKDIISNYEEVSRSLVNTKYFRDLE
jgi:LPS sulfotransferase NodH